MASGPERTGVADRRAGALMSTAAAQLTDAGSETARLDAELLVSHAFGRDRTWLHAHPDATLDIDGARELGAWIKRRAGGEPVAYIRGFKEWFGLRVATDRRALIPRPETELLAESAIAEIAARLVRDDQVVSVWDVATGGGAVALALGLRFRAALALGRVRLLASDLSPDALELAAENLAAHGVAQLVTLQVSDLLGGGNSPNAADRPPRAHLVTANLPYVTTAEVDAAPGSLAYEPRLALDGGPDGLDVLRRLVAQLPERLAPGGVALLEVASRQATAVRAEAERLPLSVAVTQIPDMAGIERVVRIARLDA
ncbi:MAG: peptide chain release factor N(5)-glutamine methyltransferase [Chloroflexi bacterium]|nr:MAG: peptide chain release factor N(5)-glutamine methyltransferase [Chloroflexota bacterium]